MEIYRIGEIIKEERKRRQISQEELSYGICSVATLSRIENGSQRPTLKVEEALLERLGHSTDNLIIYSEPEEVKKYHLENRIRTEMMQYKDVSDLLHEYQRLMLQRGATSSLELQFYKMSAAIQKLYLKQGDLMEIRNELIETIKITVPGFSEDNLNHIRLFTYTEIEILNNLALVYAKQEEKSKAIHLFYFLVQIFENDYADTNYLCKHYNMLLCNLVNILVSLKCYTEAIKYSDRGISFCVREKRMNGLPELLYYNGLANKHIGNTDEAIAKMNQSAVLLELSGRKEQADMVREEIPKE